MKKALSAIITLALVFSCFAVFAIAAPAEDPDAYFWLKGVYTGSGEDVQPAITFIIDASSFTGSEYTIYCYARFDEGTTGLAYVNQYSYSDYNAAKTSNWDYLLNFSDFAASTAVTHGQWQEITLTWNPSQNSRGAQGEGVAAITSTISFWQGNGGIAVSEIGVKDSNGDVVWSIDFADGLDLTDEFVVSYILPGEEGIYWGMVGSEITDGTEESSEEPSEEPSEETSEATSEVPSEDDSSEEASEPTPTTGDNGIIALAIIAVITIGGVAVIKKK
ncbi:MAG: hypothetical protein ACOX3X_01815 [Eubacteriales bacterium]